MNYTLIFWRNKNAPILFAGRTEKNFSLEFNYTTVCVATEYDGEYWIPLTSVQYMQHLTILTNDVYDDIINKYNPTVIKLKTDE